MQLPEFVFLKSKGFNGAEFIVRTVQPFEVYRVYWFDNANALHNFITKHALFNYACAHVTGYNILLCCVGTLLTEVQDEPINGKLLPFEISTTFKKLNAFYEQERINGNESRQKKWKTKSN